MAKTYPYVSAERAAPLGELREATPETVVVILDDAPTRKDWPRYVEAIGAAVGKGADVVWIR